MNEFTDFILYVLHGKLSLKEWINDVRKCDAFIFYDKHDSKPFRYELRKFVKDLFTILAKKVVML